MKTGMSLVLMLCLCGCQGASSSKMSSEMANILETLRAVVPAGWEVGRQEGISVITVKRKELIPSADLTIKPIPSSPAWGEDSMEYARTQGIRVWFFIEPGGTCTKTEYSRRKVQNANVRAQQEELAKKIRLIPPNPRTKPGLLARIPRNEEDKSLLSEYEKLSKQLKVLPTHHHNQDGFCVSLLKSYWGATINTTAVRKEIDDTQKAIETVLVSYEPLSEVEKNKHENLNLVTRVGFLPTQEDQHPLIVGSVFREGQQGYLDLFEGGKRTKQIIVVYPVKMKMPEEKNHQIEIKGKLHSFNFGKPSQGLHKMTYENEAIEVLEWRYKE
jgi:hypothetical protein